MFREGLAVNLASLLGHFNQYVVVDEASFTVQHLRVNANNLDLCFVDYISFIILKFSCSNSSSRIFSRFHHQESTW